MLKSIIYKLSQDRIFFSIIFNLYIYLGGLASSFEACRGTELCHIYFKHLLRTLEWYLSLFLKRFTEEKEDCLV